MSLRTWIWFGSLTRLFGVFCIPCTNALVYAQRYGCRLKQLPAELWSKVQGHLSLKDLLAARLVSRGFVSLSQQAELVMERRVEPHGRISSSMMLFVTKHLMESHSPRLSITMRDCNSDLAITFQIMLACRCANLQQLQMTDRLDKSLAQILLQTVSTSLASLSIRVPTAVMQYPTWQRMASLSHLELGMPEVMGYSALQMSILQALPNLTSLSLQEGGFGDNIIGSDSDVEDELRQPQMLYAPSFKHMGITRLELRYNPFLDGLELTQLPCLQVLCVFMDCLPSWLQGQTLETLQVAWPHQINKFNTRELLCQRIKVIACNHLIPWTPWKLSSLLAMPSLTEVSFGINNNKSNCKEGTVDHISLQGSCKDHQAFLEKVQMHCNAPVFLYITNKLGYVTSSAQLQSNGHAVACACYRCLE